MAQLDESPTPPPLPSPTTPPERDDRLRAPVAPATRPSISGRVFALSSPVWDLIPSALSLGVSAVLIIRSVTTVGGRRAYILFDDAAISMVYGRNLAAGHGLVWSVGQHPVEGYSNFLWTLWMATIFAVLHPSDQMAGFWVMVSGAVLLAANVYLIARITRRLAPRSRLAPLLAGCAVALYFALASWTTIGMETGLVAFLLAGAVLFALRAGDPGASPASALVSLLGCGVLLGLAVLARDDTLVVAVVIVLWVAVRFRPRWPGLLLLTVPVVACLVGHVAFRLAYYGLPVPNTYYLKIGGIPLGTRLERGAVVLVQHAAMQLAVPLLLAVAYFALSRDRGRREVAPGSSLLVAIILAESVYVAYAGGDSYETTFSDRFLTQVVPFLLILSVLGAIELVEYARAHRRVGTGVLAGFGLALVLLGLLVGSKWIPVDLLQQTTPSDGSDITAWGLIIVAIGAVLMVAGLLQRGLRGPSGLWISGIIAAAVVATNAVPWTVWAQNQTTTVQLDSLTAQIGWSLQKTTAPSTTVAVVSAGNVTLFDHRPSVDLLGYSDHVVATGAPHPLPTFQPGHDKWDYAYSIGRLRPDVVNGLFLPTPADLRNMTRWGYTYVPGGFAGNIYYRAGHFEPSRFAAAMARAGPPQPSLKKDSLIIRRWVRRVGENRRARVAADRERSGSDRNATGLCLRW